MSLWLVVMIQRMIPVGWCAWPCSSEAPCPACGRVLIDGSWLMLAWLGPRLDLGRLDRLAGALLARGVGRGGRLLVLGEPLGVVVGGLHLDDDRHEAVLLAAELRALPAVDAG